MSRHPQRSLAWWVVRGALIATGITVTGIAVGWLMSWLEPATPTAVVAGSSSTAGSGSGLAGASKRPTTTPSNDARDPTVGATSDITAIRSADPTDPLALPSADELAALESTGHALFTGLVLLPGGTACPGATLFYSGSAVTVSDEHGRYRVVVVQNTWNLLGVSPDSQMLAAVKVGVGAGSASCAGPSRRIDLTLEWTARFTGTTIERTTERPVPGSLVELLAFLGDPRRHEPLWSLSTTADDQGAFAFIGVPPDAVALRASAAGFASDGWFQFDLSDGRERLDVKFQLERRIHVRGWFSPWPPQAIDATAAAGSRLRAFPAAGDVARATDALETSVATDGTFDLLFPASVGLDLLLEAGGGALWSGRVDVAWDSGDVDLGRIDLEAPASLNVRLDLPPEVLELGFELVVGRSLHGNWLDYHFPFDRDGLARATPLPTGELDASIYLGNQWISFGGEDELERVTPLSAGEQRTLPAMTPDTWLVAGRVLDASGVPAAGANFELLMPMGDGFANARGGTTADGRYAVVQCFSEASYRHIPLGVPIELVARGRAGVARAVVTTSPPPRGSAFRVDLHLAPGRTLRGRALDAEGNALGVSQLWLWPMTAAPPAPPITFETPIIVAIDAEGLFSADTLEEREYYARGATETQSLDYGRVRPSADPITLAPLPISKE